jgi:hypothetical protein
VTLLYNEDRMRVFSAQAIEQLERRRGFATAADRHEGVEVTPGRLNAPNTTLPAQQHRTKKAVGLLAAGQPPIPIEQFRFARGVNPSVYGRDDARHEALVSGSSTPRCGAADR